MYYEKTYWEKQYQDQKTGWDIGYITPPIREYIDQLTDKSIKILIPGAGNAYEAEYLIKKGFNNTFVLEFADAPIENLLKRFPGFPTKNIIKQDFFNFQGEYDLIIEHTFFSSIIPETREEYVTKAFELLKPSGKLVGLLFDRDFDNPFPPFGGNKKDYTELFEQKFTIKKLETAYNSIKPRANNELFIIFEKNN